MSQGEWNKSTAVVCGYTKWVVNRNDSEGSHTSWNLFENASESSVGLSK